MDTPKRIAGTLTGALNVARTMTRACLKSSDTPPTCALCEGNHPANYKGCSVYRELKQKSFPPIRPKVPESKTHDQSPRGAQEVVRPPSPSTVRILPGRSYAQ
ncbi:hypothetical protein J6590_104766, partial [Homalodisca vitripennis]